MLKSHNEILTHVLCLLYIILDKDDSIFIKQSIQLIAAEWNIFCFNLSFEN